MRLWLPGNVCYRPKAFSCVGTNKYFNFQRFRQLRRELSDCGLLGQGFGKQSIYEALKFESPP